MLSQINKKYETVQNNLLASNSSVISFIHVKCYLFEIVLFSKADLATSK